MDMAAQALLADESGIKTERHRVVQSSQWDEIATWTEKIYLPFRVQPSGPACEPDAALHSVAIGSSILSRFSYGIPVCCDDFSSADTALVLTSLRGVSEQWLSKREVANISEGQAVFVDFTRAKHTAKFNADHLQLNLSMPHEVLVQTCNLMFGTAPNVADWWSKKVAFGGLGSAWTTLLSYVCQCVAQNPQAVEQGPLGLRLEQMLASHVLMEWSARTGFAQGLKRPQIAPRYVVAAEHYMKQNAKQAPSMGEVAMAAGVSVRSLNASFRSFRDMSPLQCLREQRLLGVRDALMTATPMDSIGRLALDWGFVNLGEFAAHYERRFGELPRATFRWFSPARGSMR